MGLSCLQLQSRPEHWPHPEHAQGARREERDTGLLGGRSSRGVVFSPTQVPEALRWTVYQ